MTQFSLLAPEWRMLIAGLLFIAAIAELALCVYQYVSTHKIKHCLKDSIVFLQLLLMLALITAEANPDLVGDTIKLPWLLIPAIAIAIFIRVFFGFKNEKKRDARRLTPFAVKQALDGLSEGVCFADSDGRLLLVNAKMESLARELVGRDPKLIGDIEAAASASSGYFRSSDGREWSFKTTPLFGEDVEGFTQMTAVCITEGKF